MSKRPLTKPFTIRMTDAEKALLVKRAGSMPLGTYLKMVLFVETRHRQNKRSNKYVHDHEALAAVLACLGARGLPDNVRRLRVAAEASALFADHKVLVDLKKACDDIAMMRWLLMQSLGYRQTGDDKDLSESLSQSFARVAGSEGDI
jgi:hypothetical protein